MHTLNMLFHILFGASIVQYVLGTGYMIPPLTGGTVLTSKLDEGTSFNIPKHIELTTS